MYKHQYIEQIKELRVKYIPDYDFSEYLREARDLISDWKYIQEHHRRTCLNKKYQIIAIPTTGLASGNFLKDIFSNLISYGNFKDEDCVLEALVIFKIVDKLYDVLQKDLKANDVYSDYFQMGIIVKYLYNINLTERTGDFVGCSSRCRIVDENIYRYKINEAK